MGEVGRWHLGRFLRRLHRRQYRGQQREQHHGAQRYAHGADDVPAATWHHRTLRLLSTICVTVKMRMNPASINDNAAP